MLDIETLSTNSNAAIVSIGAVVFDPATGLLADEFYSVIDFLDAQDYGFTDEGTLEWWGRQTEEAKAIFRPESGAIEFEQALGEFSVWLTNMQLSHGGQVEMWSNGAGFDLVVLRNGYAAADLPCPWNFWNEFDVRTLVKLGREKCGVNPKKDMPFEGEAHNALADAKHQAKYVSAIWQMLEGQSPTLM